MARPVQDWDVEVPVKVRDLMTPYPYTVDPDAPLYEALETMQRLGVHQLPVSDGVGIEGILTDRDIRMVLGPALKGRSYDQVDRSEVAMPVSRFMTEDLVLIAADADVGDACRVLAELGVRSLPVVDDADELVGILSVTDLLRAAIPLFEAAE